MKKGENVFALFVSHTAIVVVGAEVGKKDSLRVSKEKVTPRAWCVRKD
jgi:hypothetical protein